MFSVRGKGSVILKVYTEIYILGRPPTTNVISHWKGICRIIRPENLIGLGAFIQTIHGETIHTREFLFFKVAQVWSFNL